VPKFSIVIPAFNRSALVTRAIASVLQQTIDDFEIIVVDDCSTDDTREVVRALPDSRIRLLALTENRGPAGARNTGIAAATGQYISLLDSDDEYLPAFLERTLGALDGTGPEVGFSWTGTERRYTSERGGLYREQTARRIWKPVFTSRTEAMRYCLTHDAPWGTSNGVTFKRSVFERCGMFDESLRACEDMDILVRLMRDFEFRVVPECLVLYHDDALQRVDANRKNQADAWQAMYRKYHDHIDGDAAAVGFFHTIIAQCLRASGDRSGALAWLLRLIARQPANREAYRLVIRYLTGLERVPAS
jgi:glycosyltransferase involved in cell wall biosynthesis